ncbi:hypothetical protein ACFOLA_06830 [Salinicoccus hispanicus]|uniref:PTS sugar transporter subunit IIB n=1 Tax=Salinicoccus hispanicus TaxID=157225 RepID=A0A6N8U083_9STAP|nr:hypothetical protein [Salinicoccus hispanicus]MXQ51480.1 hypothetical protein [Salinicoccus hispanicus]
MNTILVATSTSENKMNTVADKIRNYCQAENIEAEVIASNVYKADLEEISPAVIVLLGQNVLETDIPIVDGVPFMTTIGENEAFQQIQSHLHT